MKNILYSKKWNELIKIKKEISSPDKICHARFSYVPFDFIAFSVIETRSLPIWHLAIPTGLKGKITLWMAMLVLNIFPDLHDFLKEHFLNMRVYGLWVTIWAIVKALGHCEEWILHIGVHAIWGILEHQLHKFLHIWFYLRSSDAGSTQVVVATIMCLTRNIKNQDLELSLGIIFKGFRRAFTHTSYLNI